jgi:hypothetical protein
MLGGDVGCGMSVLKLATSNLTIEAGTFGYPRERSF